MLSCACSFECSSQRGTARWKPPRTAWHVLPSTKRDEGTRQTQIDSPAIRGFLCNESGGTVHGPSCYPPNPAPARVLQRERDVPQATTPLLTQSLEDHRLAERIDYALRATGYGALRQHPGLRHRSGRYPRGSSLQLLLEAGRAGGRPECSGNVSGPQPRGRRQTEQSSLVNTRHRWGGRR